MDRDGRLSPRRHLPHPRRGHRRRDGNADGENVVVLARYTAVHKTTGKALNVRVAHHFVVRGGQIVRFEQFVDTALVRDAATPDA